MQRVIESFCYYRVVDTTEILTEKRSQDLYYTRYMIWYYLHCSKGVSGSVLAKKFGRNLPSIFRGIRILRHDMMFHKHIRDEYNHIVEKIEGMTEATPSENMEE